MPNWCNTRMTIIGSEEECKRFMAGVLRVEHEEPIYDLSKQPYEQTGTRTVEDLKILQAFYPCPEELHDITSPVREEQAEFAQELKAKYGSTDWYSWQNENWGTKWGDCRTSLESEDVDNDGNYVVSYAFETPWGTATKAFIKISEMFPTLRFDFFHDEEAGFFQGCEVIKNGELVYERFFAPCEYDVEMPDYDDEEAYEKWSNDHDEWRQEQQYLIDKEVDALKI